MPLWYASLGKLSSRNELLAASRGVRGRALQDLTEIVLSLAAAARDGFSTERKRWRATREPRVFVFPRGRSRGLWAAIEVDPGGHDIVLLKLVSSYGGGAQEWNDLLDDAIDRRARGTRTP